MNIIFRVYYHHLSFMFYLSNYNKAFWTKHETIIRLSCCNLFRSVSSLHTLFIYLAFPFINLSFNDARIFTTIAPFWHPKLVVGPTNSTVIYMLKSTDFILTNFLHENQNSLSWYGIFYRISLYLTFYWKKPMNVENCKK